MTRYYALPLCLLAALGAGCRRKPAAILSEVRMEDPAARRRLLRGVYEGREQWRWTAPAFALSLDAPPPGQAPYVQLDFTLPAELMSRTPTATLVARVNGVEVGRHTYDQQGRYLFECPVPPAALQKRRGPAEVEFQVDQSFTDGGRVLGLIAVAAGLVPYERTEEFSRAQMQLSRENYARVLEQRKLRLPPAKQQELMRLFHDLPVWQNLWFHNVRIIKNPLDLWMMQQILYEVRPDFIVETGTWQGGSALYWAHTLHGMGLENSRVLTVDIQDLTAGASHHFLWNKYVEFLRGSSTDPAIVARIAQRVQGRKTLVTLDSDHSMQHVLRELRMYAPLVSSGSYLVVEDTHYDGIPTQPGFGPGPMAAVRRFLAEDQGRDFEQDFSREALVMTFNPGGWLRRK